MNVLNIVILLVCLATLVMTVLVYLKQHKTKENYKCTDFMDCTDKCAYKCPGENKVKYAQKCVRFCNNECP